MLRIGGRGDAPRSPPLNTPESTASAAPEPRRRRSSPHTREARACRPRSARATEQLSARFACAAATKSINNLLLLGDGESWSRQSVDFAGIPEMARTFLQVAAAADRPVDTASPAAGQEARPSAPA